MSVNKRIRNDLILVSCVVFAVLLVFFVIMLTSRRGDVAVISCDGVEYARYDLNEDAEYVITSADGGTNTVVIKDGRVSVSYATCPDGICVKHRAISSTGQSIICLPNKLVITVERGSSDSLVDAET